MSQERFKYVIAGTGLAGVSAVEGIRELDKDGTILLIGNEKVLPYDRPPLTKKLWFGKKKIEDIFVHDSSFYSANDVDVRLGIQLTGLNAGAQTITDHTGNTYHYEKLLLAMGGIPRKLDIPGGNLWGICYYRYLHDYLRVRRDAEEGKSVVVIGGGFIGSELAAALRINKVEVTMVFREKHLVSRVFPEGLGRAVQDRFVEHGVRVISGDVPVKFEKSDGKYVTYTKHGERLISDIVIAGLGVTPVTNLAEKAGLPVENGVAVDRYTRTDDPAIYAAGDNAYFPYTAIGETVRVEHWDNALNQGKQAGRNMAGANEPYDYMPYFWSDLFEFGYEAVGDTSSELETFGDWEIENNTGILYYLNEHKVRGVMACNIYGKMDEARDLIRKGRRMTVDDLRGAISLKVKAA
ncbi:MAG TPA: FAD-dependent oxidoreductase [Armatimonadota bacterium]|jgi:NADPH-dependent 2,4-dienoyl-CoA reductase/sulfur reductase-like enzyme